MIIRKYAYDYKDKNVKKIKEIYCNGKNGNKP